MVRGWMESHQARLMVDITTTVFTIIIHGTMQKDKATVALRHIDGAQAHLLVMVLAPPLVSQSGGERFLGDSTDLSRPIFMI